MAWYGRTTALAIDSIDEFKSYLRGLDYSNWRPSGIVQHNTASPTLQQWWHSGTPPEQRVENLISYYRDDLGWSSCPHAFIDGVSIWVTCDFNVKGVHSPSWNGTRLGIEMVGDYDTESDESGEGKKVLDQTVALFGECCAFFGWDVDNNYIKQHKEDPSTTHDCPGANCVKSEFLNDIINYMGSGGEDHPIRDRIEERPRTGTVHGLAAGDTLNIRASASSSAPVIGEAVNDDQFAVVGEAMNGSTQWLRIQVGEERGTAVAVFGWASAAYVRVAEAPSRPPVEGGLPPPLTGSQQVSIRNIAANSPVMEYQWDDRGYAPEGYIEGFALAWANTYLQYRGGYPPALAMATANSGDADVDVLEWYAGEFAAHDMDTSRSGPDTLRYLWALLLGLGMRESSGQHCCGRDQSADNVASDTAEAGLFQTSYNAHTCSQEFDRLFDDFAAGAASDNPQGFLDVFKIDVSCDAGDWESYGSGDGRKFQDMCKNQPAFACASCAITLRYRRQHYGEINRKEAELRRDSELLLREVQDYCDDNILRPPPRTAKPPKPPERPIRRPRR